MSVSDPLAAPGDAASPTKAEETRARILAQGRALVQARGFNGVGIAQIVAAAQVPKGSFYYYFRSKEDFGCAMLRAYVADSLAGLDRLLVQPLPAAARLDQFFQVALDAAEGARAERCLMVKLAAEIADLSQEMSGILQQGVEALCARLADLLREGAEDGSLRPQADPGEAARLLYAQWLGAAILAKLSQDAAPLQSAREDLRRRVHA